MAKFIRSSKVRFEDCDPAGIVFYPSYFLMLNRLIEDWFSDALKIPWGIMHLEQKRGFPTVSMQVTFKKATRFDEVLEWSLEVIKLGSKSVTLSVRACCHGEERLSIQTVLVSADLVPHGISSREIPLELRSEMAAYMAAGAHPA